MSILFLQISAVHTDSLKNGHGSYPPKTKCQRREEAEAAESSGPLSVSRSVCRHSN